MKKLILLMMMPAMLIGFIYCKNYNNPLVPTSTYSVDDKWKIFKQLNKDNYFMQYGSRWFVFVPDEEMIFATEEPMDVFGLKFVDINFVPNVEITDKVMLEGGKIEVFSDRIKFETGDLKGFIVKR